MLLVLCVALLAVVQLACANKSFVYNNTYQYKRDYNITLNSSIEYILEFVENGEDNSEHPARITVSSENANRSYPIFITAGQQKGVLSWQLPVIVQTPYSSQEFSSMSRTLCPHNNEPCGASANRPLIHLSTSSPDNVTTRIRLERVEDFYVRLSNETVQRETAVRITPSQPKYYYYSFGRTENESLCGNEGPVPSPKWIERIAMPKFKSPKSVILIIESDDDICAMVSIQNYSCPVFDTERDVPYGGYYLTMMRKGGITLNQVQFPLGFYLVLLVRASDDECTGREVNLTAERPAGWLGSEYEYAERLEGPDRRVKNLRFRIVATISYKEYAVAALVALGCFALFYAAALGAALCGRRRRGGGRAQPDQPPEDEVPAVAESVTTRRRVRTHGEATSSADAENGTIQDRLISDSDTDSCSTLGDAAPEKDVRRLPARLTLASLARKRPGVLSGRTDKYLWGVMTISVFYALPVIQLVITYQGILKQTGNQDLCYYNFLCAHPLGLLSDFNHVYSNLGYVLLGALFLIAVRRRHASCKLRPLSPNHGIPQQFGLFYAMGVGLMMEGLLSASYHFCPNKMNFQFDSSFMYVIAVLSMLKIYQTRHPDINAHAHSTFGVLACIIFIGLSGILSSKYSDLNLYFWIAFTVLHLSTCLVLTFQIYYMGRFRLVDKWLLTVDALRTDGGVVRSAWRELRRAPAAALRPHYVARFVLLVLANAANWALAAYGVYEHKKDFAVHLLAILMGNTILYTLFYIVMKLVCRERIGARAWVLMAASQAVWLSSLYFFLDSRTKWSLTPAQSRSYNQPCNVLDFYDVHDLWHLLSAAAMFLSFCLLLTLDDGMESTPRDQIAVF